MRMWDRDGDTGMGMGLQEWGNPGTGMGILAPGSAAGTVGAASPKTRGAETGPGCPHCPHAWGRASPAPSRAGTFPAPFLPQSRPHSRPHSHPSIPLPCRHTEAAAAREFWGQNPFSHPPFGAGFPPIPNPRIPGVLPEKWIRSPGRDPGFGIGSAAAPSHDKATRKRHRCSFLSPSRRRRRQSGAGSAGRSRNSDPAGNCHLRCHRAWHRWELSPAASLRCPRSPGVPWGWQ